MSDDFKNINDVDSPAIDAAAITPSDSVNLAKVVKAIYIGDDGNVSLITPKGNVVTFVGLVAGTILPVRASRVNATLTTAANLIGLY